MDRWVTWILGFGVTALVVVMSVKSAPPLPVAVSASADAGAGEHADAAPSAVAAPEAAAAPDASALVLLSDDKPAAPQDNALPAGSPTKVKVGVILVEYAGAEGASDKARPKKDAQALAKKLADEAKTDFRAAVQHGDSGSADDLGFVRRGVLEPELESVLFKLPVGSVSEPVDTPRGYWIAKRIE